jgi:squalene synthase HpnC
VPVAHLQPKEYVRTVAQDSIAYSQAEALEYTRWLATHHYENFHVVSFLLPKELHQDFYNVYAYCRWADDLGDEIGDTQESLRLLSWWREELVSMYHDRASHPVFVALKDTVARYEIPIEPFDNLIRAFEQDQTTTRYQTFDDVFGYCLNSANPVGRLVLYLCGYRDAERQQLSDYTCTALQLANFWQDVTIDLQKDRIYLPLCLFDKYRYTEAELRAHRFTPAFRSVMIDAVDVAQDLFEKGLPLVKMLDRRLALDIELFSRGGLAILDKIRRQDYDVLKRRPYISKSQRVGILLKCLPRLLPF